MKTLRHAAFGLIMALLIVAAGCATEPGSNSNSNISSGPSPAASPSPAGSVSKTVPVTLPVLDALFSDEAFKSNLKTKVELTDEQLAQLQKIASEEVTRLRESNTEEGLRRSNPLRPNCRANAPRKQFAELSAPKKPRAFSRLLATIG